MFHICGKQAFSFYDRGSGRSVRLVLKEKPREMTKAESFAYYQACEPREMFDVKETFLAPVSYTHLDVYKRQLLASTSTRKKLIDSLMADVEKYDLDGLNMDFEGLKQEAVSYTHLGTGDAAGGGLFCTGMRREVVGDCPHTGCIQILFKPRKVYPPV